MEQNMHIFKSVDNKADTIKENAQTLFQLIGRFKVDSQRMQDIPGTIDGASAASISPN